MAALDASEGRRKRRKRDTTLDPIDMAIKRQLMERAVLEDPEPEAFEGWLLQHCLAAGTAGGSVQAIAQDIFAEWRLAGSSRSFDKWLAQGTPSDDAQRDA